MTYSKSHQVIFIPQQYRVAQLLSLCGTEFATHIESIINRISNLMAGP